MNDSMEFEDDEYNSFEAPDENANINMPGGKVKTQTPAETMNNNVADNEKEFMFDFGNTDEQQNLQAPKNDSPEKSDAVISRSGF